MSGQSLSRRGFIKLAGATAVAAVLAACRPPRSTHCARGAGWADSGGPAASAHQGSPGCRQEDGQALRSGTDPARAHRR
ncbi:MAG: twin-arginine translocation signal domain-containing protein [Anaerolineae bacterium]|nr:twin-arginine translocation signal domain-containing protein [Anaerolineae bacterium]